MAADEVPVLLEVAVGVPHRMGVLDHDVRPGVRGVLRAGLHLGRGLVHLGADVADAGPVVALVLDDAGGVVGLDPVVHGDERAAAARLVAEGPDDDRGVVLVSVDHVLGARHACLRPLGVVAGVVLVDAVGLQVGLVDEVQAVLVGEFVPDGVVGVVRGADRVHVQPLDHLDVPDQLGAGEGGAALGVHLVAVGAAQRDGLAVDAHQAVPQGEFAQTDPVRQRLDDLARRIAQAEDSGVEVRPLGRPQLRRRHRLGRLYGRVGAGRADFRGLLQRPGPDGVAALVVQLRLDGVRARRAVLIGAHARGDRELGGPVVVAERGVELEVTQVHGGGGIQVHRTEDAAQPDHVLVLQPVAVGVAVDLDGDLVGAGLQVPGDVVLGRGVGVLVVAHEFAVDPYVVRRLHALEVQEGTASRPVAGDGEGTAVLTDGVVAGRHGRRLGLLAEAVGAPVGVGDVEVDRAVVAVQLPHGGDGDGVPAAVVDIGAVEVGVAVGGAVRVRELPGAVEADPVRRRRAVGGQGLGGVGVRHQRGVRGFGAQAEDVDGAVPFLGAVGRVGAPGRGSGGEGERAEENGSALQQTAAADG